MAIDEWISAHANSDRCAFHFEGASITYRELNDRIDATATTLMADGVGVGDRVAYCGLNRVEVFDLLFACARLGAILLPLNNRLSVGELSWQIADSTPAVLLSTDGFDQLLVAASGGRPVQDLDAGRVATRPIGEVRTTTRAAGISSAANAHAGIDVLMVYTSGTTGTPKGAVLTQGALLHTVLNGLAYSGLDGSDTVIAALPTFHVGGLNIQTLPALYCGAQVVLHRRFDPQLVLRDIAAFRPTQTLLVPAMLAAVAGHPEFANTDLSCLEGVSTGSSVVPEALMAPFFERGVPVAQVYGATETGPTAIAMPLAEAVDHPTSCGRAAAHTEARIVDVESGEDVPTGEEGEIWLRGPHLFDRYWNNPEATAEAFSGEWYRTGDIGFTDELGYFWVSDRLGDMVISGGENVYPAEVEPVLAEHPDVAEVAVLGQPDDRWGEVVVAVVVAADPTKPPTVESLRSFSADRLAGYKQPRVVVVVGELPKTALGKVQKHVVRDRLGY